MNLKIILVDMHVLPSLQCDAFYVLDVMVDLNIGKLIGIEI